MGQLVAVTEKPTTAPGVVRFELNRALTGMGHERFTESAHAVGSRPAAELARRLFDTGQVAAVHVYANIVTIDLAKGGSAAPLAEVVRTLYRYWQPGMAPPIFEDVGEDEAGAAGRDGAESAAGAEAGGDDGPDAALAEAAKRVPMHLLERSRSARERSRAKQG